MHLPANIGRGGRKEEERRKGGIWGNNTTRRENGANKFYYSSQFGNIMQQWQDPHQALEGRANICGPFTYKHSFSSRCFYVILCANNPRCGGHQQQQQHWEEEEQEKVSYL